MNPPLAIVCNDAGGAEIVSSWLLKHMQPYCLVLTGPALAVFEKKLGKVEVVNLDHALSICNWVLCGTSWESNLERLAFLKAKSLRKKVVAYLDHWVNYRERIFENSQLCFPDEVWVGDEYALEIAKSQLVETVVRLVPNEYFVGIKTEYNNKNIDNKNIRVNILYVCEPIARHAKLAFGNERHWGYTELDAMNYFFDNLNVLNYSIEAIVIRPHPSEPRDKYNWLQRDAGILIKIGGHRP